MQSQKVEIIYVIKNNLLPDMCRSPPPDNCTPSSLPSRHRCMINYTYMYTTIKGAHAINHGNMLVNYTFTDTPRADIPCTV